jgi:hypothetical protein
VLIDSGLAYASGAAQSLFDRAVRDYAPGAALPPRVELPVTAISQLDTSCGETAVAMILKAAGEPVLVAEIDTQVQGPYGIPGLGGISGFAGNSIAVDREFARRGLSAISGPSDLGRLKQFVASGMPVMVSVGWSNGAGHLAVVSGYNEATGTLSICNWVGDGSVRTVAATEFDTAWARHMRYMTAVGRQRDPRLEKLLKATDLRRDSGVAKGFSITDFWCDAKRLLIEAAYRYVTPRTEVTVKVSFNSDGLRDEDPSAMRWLNGSIAVRQRVADGWYVGFRVEKLSLRKESGEWQTLRTMPVGAALSLEGPAFALTVAAERGAVQASLAASLGRAVADLGLRVNVSVNAEGACTVQGVLSGTW